MFVRVSSWIVLAELFFQIYTSLILLTLVPIKSAVVGCPKILEQVPMETL